MKRHPCWLRLPQPGWRLVEMLRTAGERRPSLVASGVANLFRLMLDPPAIVALLTMPSLEQRCLSVDVEHGQAVIVDGARRLSAVLDGRLTSAMKPIAEVSRRTALLRESRSSTSATYCSVRSLPRSALCSILQHPRCLTPADPRLSSRDPRQSMESLMFKRRCFMSAAAIHVPRSPDRSSRSGEALSGAV